MGGLMEDRVVLASMKGNRRESPAPAQGWLHSVGMDDPTARRRGPSMRHGRDRSWTMPLSVSKDASSPMATGDRRAAVKAGAERAAV
jgi:hypothetical protein